MARLHAQFTVGDYAQWKAMFDSDPAGRQAGGVRSYQISRGVADPNLVHLALEFDDATAGETFLGRLTQVWADAPDGAIQHAAGVVMETQDVVQVG